MMMAVNLMSSNGLMGKLICSINSNYLKISKYSRFDLWVDYRMKLATQLVVNKKRHSA